MSDCTTLRRALTRQRIRFGFGGRCLPSNSARVSLSLSPSLQPSPEAILTSAPKCSDHSCLLGPAFAPSFPLFHRTFDTHNEITWLMSTKNGCGGDAFDIMLDGFNYHASKKKQHSTAFPLHTISTSIPRGQGKIMSSTTERSSVAPRTACVCALIILLCCLSRAVAQDSCSAWVTLNCGGYTADTATAVFTCNLENRTSSSNLNSFDTGLRPTSPTSSLTYCNQLSVYDFTVPASARNRTRTIVTLIGSIPGVSSFRLADEAQIHIVLSDGTQYYLGSIANGYNSIIGLQKQVYRPSSADMTSNVMSYPFNGATTCSSQVAYQPFRVPGALGNVGVTKIRIYDPSASVKVYSVTIDTCDSYAGDPRFVDVDTYIGDHVTNFSATLDPRFGAVTVVPDTLGWSLCSGKCYASQAASSTGRCVGYAVNTSNRACYLLESMSSVVPRVGLASNISMFTIGVLPPRGQSKEGAVFQASSDPLVATYPAVMLRRPDLLGTRKQTLLFNYKSEDRRRLRVFLQGATMYALAVTQANYWSYNYVASYAIQFATGMGGRVAQCGSPAGQPTFGVTFKNNNSIFSCSTLGYCPPQAVGTSGNTLTGPLHVMFQESPLLPQSTCATTAAASAIGALLLVSHDGNLFQGATYSLATATAASQTVSAVVTALASFHQVAASAITFQDRFTVSGLSSTASTVASYFVSSLVSTQNSVYASPQWFWQTSTQKTLSTAVLCQLQTTLSYTVVAANQGMPANRYHCNASATLMALMEACNSDVTCAGVTTLAANSTTEAPWCLINNATVETQNTAALNPDATLYLKSWATNAGALECTIPTYGAYGVDVRVAQGITNGVVRVYADQNLLGSCPAPTANGTDSCTTFQLCYNGTVPKLTTNVRVVLSVALPAGHICPDTMMRALVSFDLFRVFPAPPSASCVSALNASSCGTPSSRSLLDAASATCSSGSIDLNNTIPLPTTSCAGVSSAFSTTFSFPSAARAQNFYLSVDFSNASAAQRVSGQYSVVGRDSLGRAGILGYITAPVGGTIRSSGIGFPPMNAIPRCQDATADADPSKQLILLRVDRSLMVNGISSLSLRGSNASVTLVAAMAGNIASCNLPLIYNVNAAGYEAAFYFVAAAAIPVSGLIIASSTTADFMDCATLCSTTSQCTVYTFDAATQNCTLRNAAGRWIAARYDTAPFVISGSIARAVPTRVFSTAFGPRGITATIANLFTSSSQVVMFMANQVPDNASVTLQFPGLVGYQIAVAQVGFDGDGVVVSGTEGSGLLQSCGNRYEPFLSPGGGSDGDCATFLLCPYVLGATTTTTPLSVSVSLNSARTASAAQCNRSQLLGFVGFSASAAPRGAETYYALQVISSASSPSPASVGAGAVEIQPQVTYLGVTQTLVLREITTNSPWQLTSSAQTALCRITTRVFFTVSQLSGPVAGTTYQCNKLASVEDAMEACRADASCGGFSVNTDDTVGCLSTSGNTTLSSGVFMSKVVATSCVFDIAVYSMISVSVLDINLYQGSGNNVDIIWQGRRIRRCGSSLPFASGTYSTSVTPQCRKYLQCFNDLLPGIGKLEVVFPYNATAPSSTGSCDVFQAAIVSITPQAAASQIPAVAAAASLLSVRTIKYSPASSSGGFSIMQYGATRLAVLVKQDRFFEIGTVQTFSLNVSIGGYAMGLCGGTVGFVEGTGLSGRCTTYYYCGPVSQGSPVAIGGQTGPITVTISNSSLRSTTSCNARFDAMVLTDGMLLSGQPSVSAFRTMYVYVVSVSDFVNRFASSTASVLAAIQSNTTDLQVRFPSMAYASSAVVYASRLFPYYVSVASSPSWYYALVDDIRTREESKAVSGGLVACVIDAMLDETVDNACDIQLGSSQNKVTVLVAQSNFNLVDRTVQVLVNDVVMGTCGGDHLFQGYQGLSGLCDHYFTCFDDWVTAGSRVRLVFSQEAVSTSSCTPAVTALVNVTQSTYVPPLTCADPNFPFVCNVDRKCLPASSVCNDIIDCSDRSDEGKCKNWRFAGTSLQVSCAPLLTVTGGVSRASCVRSAVIAQTPTFMEYNASACLLYSCVDFSAPNISIVSPALNFETWIYTTDASSFLYCTDALHCNNNGVVASTVPPCTCTCMDDFTGSGCSSARDLSLIDSVIGVLEPGASFNASVSTAFTTALLVNLPTGSSVSVSGLIAVNDSYASAQWQRAVFVTLTDYTGAPLSQLTLSNLLVPSTANAIIASSVALQYVTATSVVGPSGSVVCYKASMALEGYGCSASVDVNNSQSILVTVTGISFSQSTQYIDVSITPQDGSSNVTMRCGASDFVQYRDSTISGICSYRSVCAMQVPIPNVHAALITMTASSGVNPGNIVCNGYELLATVRVLGLIAVTPSLASSSSTAISYDTSHNIGFAILTAALGVMGVLFVGLLISWFHLRRRFERIKRMGPVLGFFAYGFFFAAFTALAFFVGSKTESFSHQFLIEKFRDSKCSDSLYSFIPTHVSYGSIGGPDCAALAAIGPAEGLYFVHMEARPNFTVGSVGGGSVAFRHGSKISCPTTTAVEAPLGVCLPEGILFPEKQVTAQWYVKLTVLPNSVISSRLRLYSSLNPTINPSSLLAMTTPTAGERFNSNSDSYTYFISGTLTLQYTRLGTSNDHFALVSYWQLPAATRQNPSTDPATVVFVATITTESTALSSATEHFVSSSPYVVSQYNATPYGVTFNNFNSTSTDAPEAAGSFATEGAYSFIGVRGSSTDGGSASQGFTVNFWLQAHAHTRGFVYAVIDTWIDSSYQSQMMDRLFHAIESGTASNGWFPSGWQCYHAVYLSGESESLVFMTASPTKGITTVTFDLEYLGLTRVFDERWHFVSIAVDNRVSTSPTARLFVDGQTGIKGSWLQCAYETVKSVSSSGAGTQVLVVNNRQDIALEGGMLVLGALNARLFDFSVTQRIMTTEEVMGSGAPGMELYSSIARIESLGLGITTLLLALVCFFFACRHIHDRLFGLNAMTNGEDESDDELKMTNVATTASTNDVEEAKKLVSMETTSIFDQSVPLYQFIQPVLMTVQVTALYLYAWEWPTYYSERFFPAFAAVSFDFQIAFPTTSPVLWPMVQFFLAGVLLFLLIALSWRDRGVFQGIVLQFAELLRLRQRKQNPFNRSGPAEMRAAKPDYQWVFYSEKGTRVPLTDDQEETLMRSLQNMMASRMKTEANMRVNTPRMVDMGCLGTGIILYERIEGKVFISFRASDHTAQEDRDASAITLTQTTIECIADNTLCPEHGLRLLPDDLMQYTCVHSSNPYYRSMECPRRCIMYACPHELCDYAVCEFCYNGNAVTAAVSGAIAVINQLKRRGLFALSGMTLVELASAVYLPLMRSAMMIMGCHTVFVCTFGDCWLTTTWEFILALLFAFSALIFIGGGYFVINALVVWERHWLLRGTLPSRPPTRKPFFSFLPSLNEVKEVDFEDFLQIDDSLLVTLYQPFRFKRQWFPVILYVFRFALPGAVFITNSGGLPQLLAAVVIEAFLAAGVVVAAPYKSIWIDLLSRLGSVHQFVILGLMSLHRVYIRDHPGSIGYGNQMAVATSVYLGMVGLLFMLLVVVPAAQRQWEARKRKRKEELNENRDENYDIGVWGQHVSRATLENTSARSTNKRQFKGL